MKAQRTEIAGLKTLASRRRSRPTPNHKSRQTSASLVLVPLIVALNLLALAQEASARGVPSPVSLGVRSALGGRARLWGLTGSGRSASSTSTRHVSASSRTSSTSTNDAVVLVSSTEAEEDELDESLVEPAFFRASSPHDRARLYAADYAHLRRHSKSSEEEESELEFLESSLPCARMIPVSRTTVTAAGAASPLSTSSAVRSATAGPRLAPRGGAAAAAAVALANPLNFWENMICGAVSRSVAQTVMHPANTMKTILQSARGPDRPKLLELMHPQYFPRLTKGAGANFLLSVPHGAINFAVLEFVRSKLNDVVQASDRLQKRADQIGPALDFLSSCISTVTCSVVSTPQMVITDNIMAGNWPNLYAATKGLAEKSGIRGFYHGWWPGLAGKIPSYALTWTFFQQLKGAHARITGRTAKDLENSIMGSIASATTVCIMIPMDTIKTRLVTQAGIASSEQAYKGIVDCAVRVYKEEGLRTFYRGLPPRLVSVVPMIAIQFSVYEFAKRVMIERREAAYSRELDAYGPEQALEEAAMEVAASPEHPYPAPHFLKRMSKKAKR